MGFPGRSVVKNPPANSEMQAMLFQSLGGEDPLEEETTTHSSILAWRIPWTEEPGGPWGLKESDITEHTCIRYIYAHYVCIHIYHILIIICILATEFQLIIFCVSKMA